MSKTVHVYPTGTAFINGVPAVEQEVDEDTARVWLAHQPPAFTTDPPQAGATGTTTEAGRETGLADSRRE